jgi:hypothetical protein
LIKYYFKNDSNTEIYLTNDIDINILQSKDPSTQQLFTNKDEAIVWATEFVKVYYNEELVDGESVVTDTNSAIPS